MLGDIEGRIDLALTDQHMLSLTGDALRARLKHGLGNLPRIPAARLGLSYSLESDMGPVTLALRGQNLTNALACQHSSFLKQAMPLPGRRVIFSLSRTL